MAALLIGLGGLAAIAGGWFALDAFSAIGEREPETAVIDMVGAAFFTVAANALIWVGGISIRPRRRA